MIAGHDSYIITTYKTTKLHERGKEIKEIKWEQKWDRKAREDLKEVRIYSKKCYND